MLPKSYAVVRVGTPYQRLAAYLRCMVWTVVLLSPHAALGQEVSEDVAASREDAADAAFFQSLDIEVVNVDVYVTNRRGEAVRGLTADDFELLVDERPTEISNFYAVEGRSSSPGAEAVEVLEEKAAETAPPSVQAAVPDDQRLYLIVYFDNLFLKPFNRNKVIRQVRGFLTEHIGVDDRVMLVTFERSLNLRQAFTSDLQLVSDQLFELEELTGYAVQAESARQRTLRSIRSAKTFAEAEPLVDFHAKQVFNDLNTSIDGLREMVSTLAGLPGRKALLYVSDGLPMKAGADLFEHLDQRFTHGASGSLLASRYSARSRFRELIAAANSHRVVFYTLEAIGVRSHSSISAENAGDGGSQIEIDIARDFNNQETLQMLAADTGGLAAFNTNNIGGALERMGADFTTYYSLGFTPARSGEGRGHSIKVRLKQRGLKARHRRSYRDKSPETRLLERVEASLRHGWQVNGLEANVDLGAPRRGDGNVLVPVTVSVPFREVTLLPRGELHNGRLRLVVMVIDEDGNTSTPEVTVLPLDIPSVAMDAVLEQDIVYTAEVALERGRHGITVGLRDELSGEVSVLRRSTGGS